MTPSALNKVCSRPVAVSWFFGACGLDAAIVALFSKEVSLTAVMSDWRASLFLVLALIPGTLLGYFAGMFTCWPFIRPICSRLNGAPFRVGDHVMILSGPLRGGTAEVEDITPGQGGWGVVRLDLGPERRKTFSNIFEQYSLLKIRKGEPKDRANDGERGVVGPEFGRR